MTLESRHSKQYKYLHFIVMLNMMFFICHVFFQKKFILISVGLLSIGSPFMPICDILSDIVTEVYGFAMSMRFFWAGNFIYIFFNWFCFFIINLPSSSIQQDKKFYSFLLGWAPFIILFGILLSILAYRINAYLLIKWKIMLRGRYFWLRSFTSSALAATIFVVFFIPAWVFFLGLNVKEAIQISSSALFIRLFFYLILAYPSTFIVNILKIIEQIDVYDQGLKFNPFKKEKQIENKQ